MATNIFIPQNKNLTNEDFELLAAKCGLSNNRKKQMILINSKQTLGQLAAGIRIYNGNEKLTDFIGTEKDFRGLYEAKSKIVIIKTPEDIVNLKL